MLYDFLSFANPHQSIMLKNLMTRVGSSQGFRYILHGNCEVNMLERAEQCGYHSYNLISVHPTTLIRPITVVVCKWRKIFLANHVGTWGFAQVREDRCGLFACACSRWTLFIGCKKSSKMLHHVIGGNLKRYFSTDNVYEIGLKSYISRWN